MPMKMAKSSTHIRSDHHPNYRAHLSSSRNFLGCGPKEYPQVIIFHRASSNRALLSGLLKGYSTLSGPWRNPVATFKVKIRSYKDSVANRNLLVQVVDTDHQGRQFSSHHERRKGSPVDKQSSGQKPACRKNHQGKVCRRYSEADRTTWR